MALPYKNYLTSAIVAGVAYKPYAQVQEGWREKSMECLKGAEECPTLYTSCPTASPSTTVQAYSWIKDRTFYLTFRGTQGKKDILADINILRTYLFPEGDRNILVHSGFLSYFQCVKGDILEKLECSAHLFDTIHVTGHSLGGAIATIAAGVIGQVLKEGPSSSSLVASSASAPASAPAEKTEDLVLKPTDIHKKRIVCHTVGSPRVGNTHFVKWFNSHVDENMRIANDDDPVTLFPISFLYTHVSESICIDDHCKVKHLTTDTKWYWRLFQLPFEIDYRAPISDHSCDLYIHRLMKLVSEN